MKIIVFEDEQVVSLEPVTLARPAFAITCGSRRLVDLLLELNLPVVASVRPHLRVLVEADFPQLVSSEPRADETILAVNARIVPSLSVLGELRRLIQEDRPGKVVVGKSIAVAVVPPPHAKLSEALTSDHGAFAAELDQVELPTIEARLPLLEYPHEIVREHLLILPEHLQARLAAGGYREVADGVFAAEGARMAPSIVIDATAGPILLDRDASVGPFCYLNGPAYLGPQCRVIEHAAIKHGVSLGHTTKIGGEIEASIIEPYTNKQHHGFLGHCYLGSWINLGAGTCNSDLKNTYGMVKMDYRGQTVATNMQFVGAIIGDYSKTAINTGIFTGKVIGVASMVYGFVTTNVPSFVNYARLFGQVSEAPVDVLVSTQKRMFARRGLEPRPCDIQLLADMHRLTQHERQRFGDSLSLEPLSL